jgi:hypothetical protein
MFDSKLTYPTQDDFIALLTSNEPAEWFGDGIPCAHHFL